MNSSHQFGPEHKIKACGFPWPVSDSAPRLAFLAWVDFQARSRFARTLYYPWAKMGTTRSLKCDLLTWVVNVIHKYQAFRSDFIYFFFFASLLCYKRQHVVMIKCLFSYPQRYSPNIFAAALIPLFTGLVSYGFIHLLWHFKGTFTSR